VDAEPRASNDFIYFGGNMECPKCKEKIIFKFNHRIPLRKNNNQYLRNKNGYVEYRPQYQCLKCGFEWDITTRTDNLLFQ
jgi:DNA-directed RNA polymerase subunit RPC12/RpoP